MSSNPMTSPQVQQQDFPKMFRHADASAAAYQRRYRMLVTTIVMSSCVTNLLGVISQDRLRMSITAVVTLFQFVAAMSNVNGGWNTDWYRARALAETTKSMTWRYAVGGNPYPIDQSKPTADPAFSKHMDALLHGMGAPAPLLPGLRIEKEDMSKIENLRTQDLLTRQTVYLESRVRDQENWYESRAVSLARRRSQLSIVSVGSAALAVLLSIYLVAQPTQYMPSVVALLASVALGTITISQARNLPTDVSAYQLTHYEIKSVLSSAPPVSEAEWAEWVDTTEEVFSREHTMWLGSRKIPPLGISQQ